MKEVTQRTDSVFWGKKKLSFLSVMELSAIEGAEPNFRDQLGRRYRLRELSKRETTLRPMAEANSTSV